MTLLDRLLHEALLTLYDLVPIVLVVTLFQVFVVQARPAHLPRILAGACYIFVGLTLFRLGLAESLLPIGDLMAGQLIALGEAGGNTRSAYLWLIAFAVLLGFTATLIEPTLIAVGDRVRELTGGGISAWTLRVVIAGGVALGLLFGTLRILAGIPLGVVLVPALVAISLLILSAPRAIVPLALDSGGMATSIVTVPLLTAFGIAIAGSLAGRDPLLDGFGLILMALLFPMITLLAFATIRLRLRKDANPETSP